MKFSIKYKPELVALQDDNENVLNNVCVDIHNEKTVLVATNGCAIAVIPCEVESIREIGLIPSAAIKDAREQAIHSMAVPEQIQEIGPLPMAEVSVKECIEVNCKNVKHCYVKPKNSFPNWTKIPQLLADNGVRFAVRLNPRLLADLAAAIGSPEGVVLQFTKDIIRVRPVDGDNQADGAMMPLVNQKKNKAGYES